MVIFLPSVHVQCACVGLYVDIVTKKWSYETVHSRKYYEFWVNDLQNF